MGMIVTVGFKFTISFHPMAFVLLRMILSLKPSNLFLKVPPLSMTFNFHRSETSSNPMRWWKIITQKITCKTVY